MSADLLGVGNFASAVVDRRYSAPALFHSLDAREQAVTLIEDELEKQAGPGLVTLQVVIKLRRHCAQFGQVIPRDRGQIVVLVVVTHVQRDQINRAVITERLLIEIVRIMLLNP